MDLRQLRFFCALARERHFGRAAEACAVSQPTLSSRLRQFEEELGLPLINRGSRFEGLTVEGERILAWAQSIVGLADGLEAEVTALRGALSGTLRLGAVPSAIPRATGFVAALRGRYPGVAVEVRSVNSRQIEAGLRDARFVAALTYVEGLDAAEFEVLPLYPEAYVLLFRRGAFALPDAAETPLAWREAAGLPLCLLTTDMQNRRIVDAAFLAAGTPARPVIETDSLLHLCATVADGQVAAVVPEALLEMVRHDRRLASLALADPPEPRRIGLAVLRRDPQSPLALAALKLARSRKPDGKGWPDQRS